MSLSKRTARAGAVFLAGFLSIGVSTLNLTGLDLQPAALITPLLQPSAPSSAFPDQSTSLLLFAGNVDAAKFDQPASIPGGFLDPGSSDYRTVTGDAFGWFDAGLFVPGKQCENNV